MIKRIFALLVCFTFLITLTYAQTQQFMTVFGSKNIEVSKIEVVFEGKILNAQTIILNNSYSVIIPGDDLLTPEKEGPSDGGIFQINFDNRTEQFVWLPIEQQFDIIVETLSPPPENLTNETIPPNETAENPPQPDPSQSSSTSSGGSSGGYIVATYTPPKNETSVNKSPAPKTEEAPITGKIVSDVTGENETKEKGIVPKEESIEKKINLSNIFLIGLGIVFVVEIFFIANMMLKMRK